MNKTLGQLTTDEFEMIVGRTVDKRLEVWMTQLLDAVANLDEKPNAELQPDFAASLRRAIQQAQDGKGMNLMDFRKQFEA